MGTLSQQAFVKRVKDTIDHYKMISPGALVLAAVSGGPDSMCLLNTLLRLKDKFGVEIAVVNMDHGIRGKESERDSDFVKAFAGKIGLKCYHKKIRLKKGSGGKSLEECAREERYRFFRAVAAKARGAFLATGHNMDDQAETVLMRVIKGASLSSLAGVPPVRRDGPLTIIRPLIRMEKKEIIEYLASVKWKYRKDRTNAQTKYLRNSVRLELFPFLEKYNPKIKRTLVNLSDSVREDMETLRALAGKEIKERVERALAAGAIPAGDLAAQPLYVRKEIFKGLFEAAGGNVKKLTYRHWMDAERLFAKDRVSIDLPGEVRLERRGGDIIFNSGQACYLTGKKACATIGRMKGTKRKGENGQL